MALPKNRLATTSLTLGLLGWAIYLLQWCFDLSLGLLLTAFTAGASAVCSTILDVFPFALWLVGIVTGHVALSQIKKSREPGRNRAVWGLVLNYIGLSIMIIFVVVILILVASGIGVGVLDKVVPLFKK